jgi:primary-amine oxidase
MRKFAFLFTSILPLVAQIHPLDSLTTSEFWSVYETLQKSGQADADTTFSSVLLHPPAKQAILTNQPVPRQADVILRKGNKTIAATVNITTKTITSSQELKDAQAPFTGSELFSADGPIKKDPRVIEALKKRGLTDLRTVQCLALPVAYRSTPEQATQRIGFGGCSKTNGTLHTWGRSIEGLTIQMDMVTNKIIRVIDTEVAPVPTADNNYEEIPEVPRPHSTPISTSQPMGPGYKIDKGEISWQNWQFRMRLDQRVGAVLNLVKVIDKGKPRSVMYEGHVSELFVPYMDPANGWNNRAFIDAGQFYATSPFIKPLKIGLDCPAHATYFDALFATDSGSPKLHTNMACLFERSLDTPAWRHGEDGQIYGRPNRQLILRTAAVIGNYDYIMDWRFDPDGTIEVAVGATGVIETKATAQKLPPDHSHNATDTGQYVAEHTVGVNHDHYFSYRLDMDVDGSSNSFMLHKMVPKRIENDPMRKSIWVTQPTMAATEKEAILDIDLAKPSMWMFMNPAVKGPLNYPTAYEIMPGATAKSLMSPDDPTQQIGSFSEHQFYVTPYNANERYASGVYVTSSPAKDGLTDWVKANRSIANTDIVGWYTLGFHHITRAEDWPVMPAMWHSFLIRPFHFFDKNPVLDLPKSLQSRP